MSIEKLNDIRSPGQKSKKDKILCTAGTLIAGILLGIFSKWLDRSYTVLFVDINLRPKSDIDFANKYFL